MCVLAHTHLCVSPSLLLSLSAWDSGNPTAHHKKVVAPCCVGSTRQYCDSWKSVFFRMHIHSTPIQPQAYYWCLNCTCVQAWCLKCLPSQFMLQALTHLDKLTFCHHDLMPLVLPAFLFLYILVLHTNSNPSVCLLMQNLFSFTSATCQSYLSCLFLSCLVK